MIYLGTSCTTVGVANALSTSWIAKLAFSVESIFEVTILTINQTRISKQEVTFGTGSAGLIKRGET